MNATYHASISQLTKTLDQQNPEKRCLVTYTGTPGRPGAPGNTCEVTTTNAARLIVEGTHRLANTEECEAFQGMDLFPG